MPGSIRGSVLDLGRNPPPSGGLSLILDVLADHGDGRPAARTGEVAGAP